MANGFVFLGGIVIALAVAGLRMLYQYERGVVFTLGKFDGVREPGLMWILPVIQTMKTLDMRLKTADIPRQEVITKDNIPLLANTVEGFEKGSGIILKRLQNPREGFDHHKQEG